MNNKAHQIFAFLKHWFKAKRRGHGVHSPFAFQLCEEVFYNKHPFYDFEILAEERKKLLKDSTIINMKDFGAGSDKFIKKERKVCDIAVHGISRRSQSEILYRLINYMQSKTNIELGTSLGLNALYMAAAAPKGILYSIDACEDLCLYAEKMAKGHQKNHIQFICAQFQNALPKILSKHANIGVVYIDGNHSYEATMTYFKQLLHHVDSNSVLVFDDIYWSENMTKAWIEIQEHPKVRLSIDTYFSGYVFFNDNFKEKQHYSFYLPPGKLLPYLVNPQ